MNKEDQIITLLTEIRDLLKPKEKKAVKRFEKPSYMDVDVYCTIKNNGVDAQSFIDFYESNGWKVGKNPMKNWKAALTTWSKRNGKQTNGYDQRSRAQKVSDKLDEIARKDIEQNGFTSELG